MVVFKAAILALVYTCLLNFANSAPSTFMQNLQSPRRPTIGSPRIDDYVVEGNFNHANTMDDLKKKLSMTHIAADNICYLSKMKPTPTKQQNPQFKVNSSTTSKIMTIWAVVKPFNHRSVLSKDMANLCSRSQIYWVTKTAENTIQSYSNGSKTSPTSQTRQRRSPHQVCGSKICKKRTGFFMVNGVLKRVKNQVVCITLKC